MTPAAQPTPVREALEVGRTWVFAAAMDWPGWCRRGKSPPAALAALLDHAGRYGAVAGPEFAPGELIVVEECQGTSTTDFGAPDAVFASDAEALGAAARERAAGLLVASWQAFDRVVVGAPERLRTGPRGGGRDRDGIVDHVREAERSYARKVGARLPPRTPWPDQRTAIIGALGSGAPAGAWSPAYAFRRSPGTCSITPGKSRTRARACGNGWEGDRR